MLDETTSEMQFAMSEMEYAAAWRAPSPPGSCNLKSGVWISDPADSKIPPPSMINAPSMREYYFTVSSMKGFRMFRSSGL